MTLYRVTVVVEDLVDSRSEFSAIRRLVRDLEYGGFKVSLEDRKAVEHLPPDNP